MRAIGQLNPIQVTDRLQLIAGYHRVLAARELQWPEIDARIFEGDELNSRLAEIDENLVRLELSELERGELILEREAVLKAMGLRANSGTNLKNGTGDKLTPVTKTTADIATEMGVSERTLQRTKSVVEKLPEPVRDAIRTTPVANNRSDLERLAKEVPETQAAIVEQIKTGAAQNVTEARQQVNRLAPLMTSASEEWYTPVHIVDLVRDVLGDIDLDPASHPEANKTVCATEFYTKRDNGLLKPWTGRVYLNPPYGDGIGAWTEKLITEFAAGNIESAIALVPGRIDTQWFAPLYDFPICAIRGRLKFGGSSDNAATFPSVAVYLGGKVTKFVRTFNRVGVVVERVKI